MSTPLTSHTTPLTPEQGARLRSILEDRGYVFKEAPYTHFSCQGERISVSYFTSGKLVIQGKGTEEFIKFTLEPDVLGQAKLGYETVVDPSLAIPRIGVDESGKGDLFGPLCAAAVYANEEIVKQWLAGGVRDSKQISSAAKIEELSEMIRQTPGAAVSVVPIGNPAYNRLYAKIGNLNKLLAWAHGRAIEDLLEQNPDLDPRPVRIVVDQFARDPRVVQRALMPKGRELELIQRTKAEADPVVAAASIVARDEFVRRLKSLEKHYGVKLPKGASGQVNKAVLEFIRVHGEDKMGEVAKLHFSNARPGDPEAGSTNEPAPAG